MDFLLKIFSTNGSKDAVVWKDSAYSYAWLADRFDHWKRALKNFGVAAGDPVLLEADFTPNSIALFLALADEGAILLPVTPGSEAKKLEIIKIGQPAVEIRLGADDQAHLRKLRTAETHPLYKKLKGLGKPGLVLFSSGSSGCIKGVVHNLHELLNKFKVSRYSYRTISFLLYDHIGGVNTMLYTLSNGGCLITIDSRMPDRVLETIEKYKVELLPTSPTFINWMLLGDGIQNYDLSSLKKITYGTEPMPESTLRKFHELFPGVELLQTYGLSEVGILRSKSKSSDSLWMKIGGEGFQTRVVDGRLHVKAASAMLGYLNAPSPFTEDGWLDTGDSVLTDGEYIRILGRASELINVGGEKVYPAEVESIVQEMENVAEAIVYAEKSFIIGHIVCVKVRLLKEEDPKSFTNRLKKFCAARLERFKVPVKIEIVDTPLHGERVKKLKR